MSGSPPKAVGASAPPPLVFVGGFILAEAINFLRPFPIWPGIWILPLGVLLFVLGVALLASAGRTFARHKTPLDPWEPAVELVQDGPYRFTRNPVYLSFSLIYLGLSFIFNSLPALIVLVPLLVLIDRKQILREEAYLEQKFGEEYRRYRAQVRRWV